MYIYVTAHWTPRRHPVLVQYIGSDIIAYSTFLFVGVLKLPIRQTTEDTSNSSIRRVSYPCFSYVLQRKWIQPDLRDIEARYMRFNAQLIQNVAWVALLISYDFLWKHNIFNHLQIIISNQCPLRISCIITTHLYSKGCIHIFAVLYRCS